MEAEMFEIIEPKHHKRLHERTIDTLKMLYGEGKTLEQLGYFLGVSRERIRQVLDREGISAQDGGQTVRKNKRIGFLKAARLVAQKKTEAKMEQIFQCPYVELTSICGMPVTYTNIQSRGSPQNGYFQQKRNAETRGIAWEMTFPQWWKLWQDSGHWAYRGRGKYNYCMSRREDKGPYSPANVKIITNFRNTREGQTKFSQKVRRRDGLGLTTQERRIYEILQIGIYSPTSISKLTGLSASTIGQIKQNLKGRLGIKIGEQKILKRAAKRGNGT